MLTKIIKVKLQFPKLNFPDIDRKSKGDIVTLYEKLTGNRTRRVGKVHMVLCPFHDERTPSMALYPDTSSYHCFGCDASGDTIDLVRKLEGLSFEEALEKVKSL